MNWANQLVAILRFSLMGVPARKGSVLASLFGIAGVVAVLVGVLSIASGFRSAMTTTGAEDVAIVLRSGADTEMVSGLSLEDTRLIADAPGIARDELGPRSAPELFVVINLPKRTTGTDANVPLRGVSDASFSVRGDIEIVEGRRFERGKNEVIVGHGAAAAFAGLDVGRSIEVGANQWNIVGRFRSSGGIAESEIWTDAPVLQDSYRRGTSYQSVLVQLQSPGAFDQFEKWLGGNPQLSVTPIRQSDFYAGQSGATTLLITSLGVLIAVLMAIGAIFGALNTMFAAVAARTREIATLRALGFGSSPIVLSVIVESLLIAFVGGAIGGVCAWIAFDGIQTSTLNFSSFSQVAFAFRVTPALLVLGTVCAGLIGVVGGLFPALRAARLPVALALREN
jgi:putative ABC transport system permease protein